MVYHPNEPTIALSKNMAIRLADEQAAQSGENFGIYQDLIGGMTVFRVRPVTMLGAGILVYSVKSGHMLPAE